MLFFCPPLGWKQEDLPSSTRKLFLDDDWNSHASEHRQESESPPEDFAEDSDAMDIEIEQILGRKGRPAIQQPLQFKDGGHDNGPLQFPNLR